MASDVRVTWGSPPERGADLLTFCTISATSMEDIDTLFAPEEEEELPAIEEPTSEGPIKLADAPPPLVAGRYERRTLLGSGGMGEVWRVYDRVLRRPIALKVIRSRLVAVELLSRFREEAQVSAQLQHPGIIPVHDSGELEDGRVWFTMKEVRGTTLEELLQEVHKAWRMGQETTESGFTFRRMLESFLRVCETMAYSHSRGVVHRDLKPANIMLGGYGEVLVLDWGLAKLVGVEDRAIPVVDLGDEDSRSTKMGAITGTPAYMSPEQARGQSAEAGPAADVYALGATLYDLLCERPPRLAATPRKLVLKVALGVAFPAPREIVAGPAIDEELERICLKALETEVEDRYPDAAALAVDLAQWLDDARKRERAMAFVDASRRRMKAADAADDLAVAKAAEAVEALRGVAENAPVTEKVGAWALQDEVTELEEEARSARTEAVQELRAALSHAPALVEAHDGLADHYRGLHGTLETKDAARARQVAKELVLHDRSDRYGTYLRGTGALTLVTDVEGVEARLHRYVLRERRLTPVFERSLGLTPLVEVPLEMGNYLITLHRAGFEVVRYPVLVERQEHWHGLPPGLSEPHAVHMPVRGAVATDECYVPAGWFWFGDDGSVPGLPPFERRWCDAFVIKKFPVTVGEYSTWLNELLDAGRKEEAERYQPRTPDNGVPVLRRDSQGRFGMIRNEEPGWEHISDSPRMPMLFTRYGDAVAFAAAHESFIPSVDQWVRASRGADRRAYPWGNHFEFTWCQSRRTGARIGVIPVDDPVEDSGVFGMRGAAGNVSEWAETDAGSIQMGGFCGAARNGCRLVGMHVPQPADQGLSYLSFRVARKV